MEFQKDLIIIPNDKYDTEFELSFARSTCSINVFYFSTSFEVTTEFFFSSTSLAYGGTGDVERGEYVPRIRREFFFSSTSLFGGRSTSLAYGGPVDETSMLMRERSRGC